MPFLGTEGKSLLDGTLLWGEHLGRSEGSRKFLVDSRLALVRQVRGWCSREWTEIGHFASCQAQSRSPRLLYRTGTNSRTCLPAERQEP